jgi:D-alanyl-D-alanine-carboxypeptidase/D-alanyl-D-alanine-endopeptidase
MRPLLALLLLATLLCAEPLAERVDAIAAPFVDGGKVRGMVVGVYDGKEELFRGYGAGEPGADTVYEIGSVSKVFTGVLLAALVRDGVVKLDEPVEELLPEGAHVPSVGDRKITLVDLSTHTSGLPRMPDNFEPADPHNPYADYTPERMLAFLAHVKLARAPGAAYEYSNVGVGLLGWALARKAGKSYEDLLFDRITGPLGMKSTVVALTPELKARLAPGHDAALRPESNWDLPAFAGAGGIRSTAADMMRFLRANLEEGPLSGTLAFAREVRYTPPDANAQRLGLGWHISPAGIHWHNGQTGGYHSFVALDVKNRRAVVVLADTATGEVDALGGDLLRLLAGESVTPREVRKEVEVKPEVLAAYAGTYKLFGDFKLTVTVEDGRLMVQATGQQKFPVFATSETEFFYKVVDAQISFQRDASGKTTGLVLHQNGQDMPGIRY